MVSKRLIPVVALILLVAAIAATGMGASQPQGVRVPPGELVESPNARRGDVANRAIPDAPAPVPAGPTAAEEVAVSEQFSDNNLDKWQSLPAAAGTWVARDGRLQQRGDAQGVISSDETVLALQDYKLANGTFEAYVYPTSGDAVGLVFRGSDAGYYRVRLFQNVPNSSPKAILERVTPTTIERIAQAPAKSWAGYQVGQWQRLSVKAEGDRLQVAVDGNTVFDVTHSAFSASWVGLLSVADMGAQFDNVRVLGASGQ